MAIDLTQLAIDISALSSTADKKKSEIKELMVNSIKEMFPYLKMHKNMRSSKDLLTSKEGSILQPFDAGLTAGKELAVIDKRTLSLDTGMIYVVDEFERYRDTYLATLEELNLPHTKLPFADWYVLYIAKVAMQDMHDIVFLGEKQSATTPAAITDGFNHIIEDEKTATNISVGKGNLYELSGSATDYTASIMLDELISQWELFPAKTRKKGVDIHIPYAYQQMYKEAIKAEYTNITDGDVNIDALDGTDGKARFNWTTALGSTKKVVMTTRGNFAMGIDAKAPDFGKLEIFHPNGNPYYVGATAKMAFGFQIHTINSREFNVNNL